MDWFDLASKTREAVKTWGGEIVLIFHNDADGLASGTLAKIGLEAMGKKPTMYCIEKMYPEIVEKIHAHHGNALFIYADIGSGEIEFLERVNQGRVIILDHHKTNPPTTGSIINLDPELFGMNGGEDACGATLTYLFFKEYIPREYIDLALVGMQEIPGEPRGLNELVVKEYGKDPKKKLDRFGKIPKSVSRDLTILGSVGYYQGGVSLGLELAEKGYTKNIKDKIKEFEDRRKAVVRGLLYSLKLKETKNVQWFDAGDAFKGMGTKTIGTFCSFLVHKNIAPNKVLLGFMNVEKKIPKLNGIELELTGNYSKVSARAPDLVKARITGGGIPGLGRLLAKACSDLGGFADGHDFAASGIIPRGKQEALVLEIERELGGEEQKGLGSWIS